MTLAELLSELRNNMLRDRSDIIAGDTDCLWSDETLINYIGDAERRFARRTLLLRDSMTPEVCQFKLKTGVATYPMHPTVLSVLSARATGSDQDLLHSGHAILTQMQPTEFLTFDPMTVATMPPGQPIAYYTDESTVFARQGIVTFTVFPPPAADQNDLVMNMRVIRLPFTKYDLDHLDTPSEIPEDYQLDVLGWAAYRALRGFDSDAGAPTSAEAHKAAFEEAIGRASNELKRKMFVNTGLRYGGNGFSWTR